MIQKYEYGLMYEDGSVNSGWNNNTQEQRAQESLDAYHRDYPDSTEAVKVVRRLISAWEPVSVEGNDPANKRLLSDIFGTDKNTEPHSHTWKEEGHLQFCACGDERPLHRWYTGT